MLGLDGSHRSCPSWPPFVETGRPAGWQARVGLEPDPFVELMVQCFGMCSKLLMDGQLTQGDTAPSQILHSDTLASWRYPHRTTGAELCRPQSIAICAQGTLLTVHKLLVKLACVERPDSQSSGVQPSSCALLEAAVTCTSLSRQMIRPASLMTSTTSSKCPTCHWMTPKWSVCCLPCSQRINAELELFDNL